MMRRTDINVDHGRQLMRRTTKANSGSVRTAVDDLCIIESYRVIANRGRYRIADAAAAFGIDGCGLNGRRCSCVSLIS